MTYFRSSFLIYAFNTISSPPSTAFTTSHKFGKLCFHLVQNVFKFILISSWTYLLLRSVSFNFHIFGVFQLIFPFLISSLILLWFESRHYDFCSYKFVKCVLWPRMFYVIVNVPSELERNVYSSIFR